jgi:hypothetical protein
VASAELRESLEKFVKFARNLKGDEKSEAQPFLDRFFRAFGHEGVSNFVDFRKNVIHRFPNLIRSKLLAFAVKRIQHSAKRIPRLSRPN